MRVWNTQNKFVYWYKSLKMKHINKFYEELRRCDDANPIYRDVEWGYNGIVQARGVEGYHQFINKLYNDAVDELTEISENEKVVCKIRLDEIEELQKYFDAPTRDMLEMMERECLTNNNKCLREEMEHVRFVVDCVSLQNYYLTEFGKYLHIGDREPVRIAEERLQEQKYTQEENEEVQPPKKSLIVGDIIRGRQGVAEYTGLGLSSVQKLINMKIITPSPSISGVLDRTHIFSKKRLDEELFGNPEYEKIKKSSGKRGQRR